jgi:hypothetical protein
MPHGGRARGPLATAPPQSWQSVTVVTGCATIRELTSVSGTPKVHDHIRKSSPLELLLSHTNPVHTAPFLRFILMLANHLRLGHPSDFS